MLSGDSASLQNIYWVYEFVNFRRNLKLQNLRSKCGILHFRVNPLYLLGLLLVSLFSVVHSLYSLCNIMSDSGTFACILNTTDMSFIFLLVEPKSVIDYLQTLKSSEESLREQVWCMLLLFTFCWSFFSLFFDTDMLDLIHVLLI